MNERMESVSSQDAPRKQETPTGADFQEETVNPAWPEDPSREAEEQRLME